MSSGETGPAAPVEIHSDEDRKARVRAENDALDERVRQEREPSSIAQEAQSASPAASVETPAEAAPKPTSEPAAEKVRTPLPTADFRTLVTMLTTQAMVGLGFIPHPATGQPAANRDLARHFIDLLGILDEKTRNNLDAGERRLIDSSLHDLRMAFIETTRRGDESIRSSPCDHKM